MRTTSIHSANSALLTAGVTLFATLSAASAAINYTTLTGVGAFGDPFIAPAFQGNTSTSIWYNVRAGGSVSVEDGGSGVAVTVGSGFPGSGPFNPIAAQVGNTNAILSKTANGSGGGAYPASESIYFGGFSDVANNPGGTLAVGVTTPLAGLDSLAFQLQVAEAWTYDLYNGAMPVLTYTTLAGTVSNVAATYSTLVSQIANGTVTMPSGEEPIFINTYAVQWDLSSVVDPITSFSVSFQGVQHSRLHGLRLDQSDTFSGNMVPEPSSMLLGCVGAVFLFRRRR